MVLGKLDTYIFAKERNWTIFLHHLRKSFQSIKLLEENINDMLFDINLSNIFLAMPSQAKGNKNKEKQMELQTKNILCK